MPSHRRSLTAALALAAALTLPDAAKAAYTVSYSASSGLLIQGDAGNDGAEVFFAQPELRYHVRPQTGSTLMAGAGCTRLDTGVVECAAAGNRVITGTLGAGNDRLDGGLARVIGDMFVDGGGGDDVIVGGLGFDALDGGAGADVLNGSGGNDVVEGGDGDDRIIADGGQSESPGSDTLRGEGGNDTFTASQGIRVYPDRIEGGAGVDRVDYSARTAGVSLRVNFGGRRDADDGQPGEGDDIGSDVEILTGGSGPDSIIVTQAPGAVAPTRLQLNGNAGRDQLASNTSIVTVFDPGIGEDVVVGSAVEDKVLGRDAEHDTVDCNGGLDGYTADLRDSPISSECEQVDQGAVKEGPNVVVRSKALRVERDGAVSVRLRCPRKLRIACEGSLAVRGDRKGSRFGARARYRIRRGRSATVRVVLPRAQRSRARRRGGRLRLRSVERGSHGPKTTLRLLAVRR
jgi:hypothetical protein